LRNPVIISTEEKKTWATLRQAVEALWKKDLAFEGRETT